MTLISTLTRTKPWTFLATPPMSGAENMAFDLSTVEKLQRDEQPPVLRFFRWAHPAVSYGKHQRLEAIAPLIPNGWESVQRPTGGGVVFHDQDLCLSLCWRAGQDPLPANLKDVYNWIHSVILEALPPLSRARLADCRDCRMLAPFATRHCFSEPVAFDILSDSQKIAGGAICRRKTVFLYQGSIQDFNDPAFQIRLQTTFQHHLCPPDAV